MLDKTWCDVNVRIHTTAQNGIELLLSFASHRINLKRV